MTEELASRSTLGVEAHSYGERRLHVKVKLGLLIALLGLHVIVSWVTIVPGYLLIDEVCYHWMARDFSATGGLVLWNGYDEFPSVELSHRHLPIHRGRVVATYPYLFPVICLPSYRLLGFEGLPWVNVIAFVGVVLLCLVSARRMFGDLNLALNACFILIFATFAWEYSQAAWPHATSLLFVMGAFYLWVRAYHAQTRMEGVVYSFLAGVVAGLAPGLRLESFLVLPCLLLPFLFARPWRPLEALMFALGALPGLAILAATNYVKFGAFTPLTYGEGAGLSVPALVPTSIERLIGIATNAVVSLLDVRALDVSVGLPSLDRTPSGGMIYIGAHKKSLIQSMPFLVLLIVPLVRVLHRGKDFADLCVLFLVPSVIVGYYAYFPHEYGGLCLNFRYFVAFLPFVVILCAYGLRELEVQWGKSFGTIGWVSVLVATGLTYWWLISRPRSTLVSLEFPVLDIPLILAGLLLFLLVAGLLVKTEGSRPLRVIARVVLVVAMAWASCSAFLHDYPRHFEMRVGNAIVGEKVLSLVPGDSLFFSHPFLAPTIIEGKRIRVAFPAMDRGRDMPRLVEFHLSRGRRVFGLFSEDFWTRLQTEVFKTHAIKRVAVIPGGSFLGEICRGHEAATDEQGGPGRAADETTRRSR